MARNKEDFFSEIDKVYNEINRLEKKAIFFIEENACGSCKKCCTSIATISVCATELDYIKSRVAYKKYSEEEFIFFLNTGADGLCSNYDKEINGCGIYNTRPLVCRTFGYTVDPMMDDVDYECSYKGKKNSFWPEIEQQVIKFNILKQTYFNDFFEQITPKTAYDYMIFAEISLKKVGIEKAIEFYESAKKIFQNNNKLRMSLVVEAKIQETLKELEKALIIYYKILNLYPNDIRSMAKLANIEFSLEKYDDSIKHLTKSLEYIKTPPMYDMIALSYIKKGDYQKALDFYNISLEQFKNNHYLLTNKAMALQKLDRDEEAIELLQSIIEKGTKNALIYLSLSISFQKKGDYIKAQECIQKAQSF